MNTRRFADLNCQEALHVAIFIEERNAEMYGQFAELFAAFKDPDSLEIAQTFWDMAEEERQHGTKLQDCYTQRYGTQPCAITEEHIKDMIELPKLDNADLFSVTRSGVAAAPRHMALEVGLKAEQSALRFYGQLAATTQDSELRALYNEFSAFEGDHVAALQSKLNETRRAPSSPEA